MTNNPTPDSAKALTPAERLKKAGAPMANTMFNLAQRETMPAHERALFKAMQREWDDALAASPDSAPAQEAIHVCPTCNLAGQAIADARDAGMFALAEWKRFAGSLTSMIGEISAALGISEEDQACANGADEILDCIAELKATPPAQEAAATQQPAERDREADRARFPDPQFNRWLDEAITENGEYCVWHQIGDTCAAWHGWKNREFYPATTYHPAAGAPRNVWPMLDAVVDIYFDGVNHAPEDRCYVDGSLDQVMNEAKALLATTQQPDTGIRDAYEGAREDLLDWKRRALEAEQINRNFSRALNEENGPTFMGEPVIPRQPAASAVPDAWLYEAEDGKEVTTTRWLAFGENWTETPLYAAPIAPEPAQPQAAGVEAEAEIMRVWFVLKDAGLHPGRTDDRLHEVVRAALAAGDGTLHGAIDYWQSRALAAEAGNDANETNHVLADNYIKLTCGAASPEIDALRGVEKRARELHEKASMPLGEAHELAVSEASIPDVRDEARRLVNVFGWARAAFGAADGGSAEALEALRDGGRHLEQLHATIDRLAAAARQAPTGADAVDAQALADRVKNGIADFIADNWPMRKHDLSEIETGVRSIEVNAGLVAARKAQPTRGEA